MMMLFLHLQQQQQQKQLDEDHALKMEHNSTPSAVGSLFFSGSIITLLQTMVADTLVQTEHSTIPHAPRLHQLLLACLHPVRVHLQRWHRLGLLPVGITVSR